MPEAKKTLGNSGEKIAERYLKNKGYEILDLNYQNTSGLRIGEIDIIAQDLKANQIVFVEVKTRSMKKYGSALPEENITRSKLHKLAKIASAYLLKKNWRHKSYRFDAISVWLDLKNKTAKVKHMESIFL